MRKTPAAKFIYHKVPDWWTATKIEFYHGCLPGNFPKFSDYLFSRTYLDDWLLLNRNTKFTFWMRSKLKTSQRDQQCNFWYTFLSLTRKNLQFDWLRRVLDHMYSKERGVPQNSKKYNTCRRIILARQNIKRNWKSCCQVFWRCNYKRHGIIYPTNY